MKKSITAIFLFSFLAGLVFAQAEPPHPFSDFINQQWMLGKKKEALQVAQARLKADPNDLAALLICFDYGVSYEDRDLLYAVLPQIKDRVEKQDTPDFRKTKKILLLDVSTTEKILPKISAEEAARESHKGDINGKPFTFLPYLKALESDRAVSPLTEEEKARIMGSTQPANNTAATRPNTNSIAPIKDSTAHPSVAAPTSNSSPSNVAQTAGPVHSNSWMLYVLGGVLLAVLVLFAFRASK